MNNSSQKSMGMKVLRLLFGVQLALLGAVGCSSKDTTPTPSTGPCGNVAQCPVGQGCNNNVCTPFQMGGGGAGNNLPGGGASNNVPGGGAGNNVPGGGAGNNLPGGGAGNNVPGGGAGNNVPGGGAANVPGAGAGNVMTGSAGAYTGAAPAGFWVSKDWHGCSWTGKGVLGVTTVTPQDFVTRTAADPFCISGTVGAEPMYKSVALLGFNVNEANPATCAYKPVDTTALGPPGVVPQGDGIAVNFVKKGASTAFTLRLQIQGPNGAKDGAVGDADRWCATITEVQGKVFKKWSEFTNMCWGATAAARGATYTTDHPISAVVLSVPGTTTDTPYNFCVNGLAYGTSAADAPDGTAIAGDQTGTIGGPGTTDVDFSRAKVNVGGHDYIIQNNNWGNPAGTDLALTYKNNSFKVTGGTGSGGDAPASFPSIFIGNNGNTANGVFSTKPGDNLPIQISAITSMPSTLRYSGSTGVFNATYDIWFANSPPTMTYNDGIDGFVMIWLRDPSGKQPIGSKVASAVTVAGKTWDVWKGPRGPGPMGSQSSAPVVSFVNPTENDDSRAQNFVDVNIKDFIVKAADYGISNTMYLTDVFGGFEIWSGGSGGNLGVDEFKCVVNK